MKTLIKIRDVFVLQDKTLLQVEIIEGDRMLINDVFKSNDLKFVIKNIGIIESRLENIYPLNVLFETPIDIAIIKDKIFEKVIS